MAEKLDPKEIVTPEEVAISNMWEIAALVELLDRKGLITKQEVLDMIQELRRKNPTAVPPPEPFPEPYLLTEAENALIDRIFELINATGLTAHQAKNLLARVRRLIDLGERLGDKTTH
jgi:hypothetical protein